MSDDIEVTDEELAAARADIVAKKKKAKDGGAAGKEIQNIIGELPAPGKEASKEDVLEYLKKMDAKFDDLIKRLEDDTEEPPVPGSPSGGDDPGSPPDRDKGFFGFDL